MKIFKSFCCIVAISLLLTGFSVGNKSASDEEPMYYISVAWETTAFVQGQPVITNVAYAGCKYHSTNMIANQLTTYYNAFYKSARGTSGINRISSWRYDTADKAEKKRRELIAAHNQKWEPVLIEKFSVSCD